MRFGTTLQRPPAISAAETVRLIAEAASVVDDR